MALFITKPIMWNRDGYRRPSGVLTHSGYPAEHGFGHEEWNGAPGMTFAAEGIVQRAFHTEGVGNSPVADEAGSIFVFMYASHSGVQELVGVAGNATCLIGDRPQRESLVERLRLNRLAEDAWAVPRVRALHANDRVKFERVWRADLHWIPNWRCPVDTYLWLERPVLLDPKVLRGTSKLLTMFGRHTEIDRDEALDMLAFVPIPDRTPHWYRILAEIQGPNSRTLLEDISAIRGRKGLGETTRKRLVDARLGQGRFRGDVERLWGGACAVSGCTLSAALRASHILAWSQSNDQERLDGENGLLLTADLDALFDRGLISFADNGEMLVSTQVGEPDRKLFALPRSLRKAPSLGQKRYLSQHRRRWVHLS